MMHGIRNGIAHAKGNSLSPEPCALSPIPVGHSFIPSNRTRGRGKSSHPAPHQSAMNELRISR